MERGTTSLSLLVYVTGTVPAFNSIRIGRRGYFTLAGTLRGVFLVTRRVVVVMVIAIPLGVKERLAEICTQGIDRRLGALYLVAGKTSEGMHSAHPHRSPPMAKQFHRASESLVGRPNAVLGQLIPIETVS